MRNGIIGITGNYYLNRVLKATDGVPVEKLKRVADDSTIYFQNDDDAYKCFEENFPGYTVEIEPCTAGYPYKYRKYPMGYIKHLKVTLKSETEEAVVILSKG